jgi:hypothetical protein
MSFLDCIRRALDDGSTDAERAQATQDAYQQLATEYERFHDRRTAEEMAYQDVLEAFQRDSAVRRHQALASLRAMRQNVAEVTGARNLAQIGLAKLERVVGRADQVESVRYNQDAIQEMAFGMLGRLFNEIHPNITGGFSKAQTARLANLGRELVGESTGDATARSMAEAVKRVNEMLRLRFNEAGGHIGQLEGWGFRQTHNWREISKRGQDAFLRTYAPELFDKGARGRLDWSRIENFMTGRPFSEASDEAKLSFLRDVYRSGTESIYAPVVEPRYGPAVFGNKMADRHSHQRVLHFRTYDDWKAVSDEFGGLDLFTTLTNHIRGMARDISLMEAFGPNPRYGLEHRLQVMRQEASKRDTGDGRLLRSVSSMEPRARAMMDQLTGLSGTPEGHRQAVIANFFSNVRQYLNASYLGGAVLASAGDFASTRLMASTMRLNPRNIFSRYTRLMASQMDRADAARAGWIASTLTDHGAGMARFSSEVPGSEFMSRLSGFVMRAQGLSWHTDHLRLAVRMEMAGEFARLSKARATLDDLPEMWADTLRQRGITDQDWADFTDPATLMRAGNGAEFLPPTYWMQVTKIETRRAERIATTMLGFIEEATEIGIPTRSVTGDALITMGTRPGTILGELALSGRHMKSFAISTWINLVGQTMMRPTAMSRAQFLAMGAVWFGMMGAISLQVKEIAKGNDPRPMDTVAFWGAAGMQGGGFGIAGDLLASAESRIGGGLGGYLAGPTVGLTESLVGLTSGNVLQAMRGEDTNFGRELAQLARRTTPIASSYWPTRAAFDRMVFDQAQMLLDPEAEQSMRRSAQNQLRSYGNESWWGDAQMLPDRAPSLDGVLPGF